MEGGGGGGRPVCVVGHEILLPLPRQKSTKIERKSADKLSLIGRCNYRYREKSRLCPMAMSIMMKRTPEIAIASLCLYSVVGVKFRPKIYGIVTSGIGGSSFKAMIHCLMTPCIFTARLLLEGVGFSLFEIRHHQEFGSKCK